jgi:hypothetical protein
MQGGGKGGGGGGKMTQTLYAHMNKKKKKKESPCSLPDILVLTSETHIKLLIYGTVK